MMSNREARRHLKAKLTPTPDSTREWYRACGQCLCECGYEYQLHPLDEVDVAYDGTPYMHVLCNGDRVKL